MLDKLKIAKEVFCCGTGASITPVSLVNVANQNGSENNAAAVIFGYGSTPGELTQRLHKLLMDIQTGEDEELNETYRNWIHIVRHKFSSFPRSYQFTLEDIESNQRTASNCNMSI